MMFGVSGKKVGTGKDAVIDFWEPGWFAVVITRDIAEILFGDFFEGQETMAFGAIVDKCSLETGFDPGYFSLVNVALFLLPGWYFDIEIVKFLAIDHSHSQLFALSGVY